MLVKDLQQFLGSFTDKLKDGKGRGNAVQYARIYIEVDGYLEEIKRMEVQENNIIGAQQGLRLVLKPLRDRKIILPPGVRGDYQKGEKMEITDEQRKQLLAYLSKRPYAEVFTLIAMLLSLKPKTTNKDNDTVTPKKQVGPESKLHKKLVKITPKIVWNRIENLSNLGTPDLLGYNTFGTFFTVELKVTKGIKIRFSPHQIAWHIKHPKNSFILAEALGPRSANRFQMFRGSRILELEACGLALEPLCLGLEA